MSDTPPSPEATDAATASSDGPSLLERCTAEAIGTSMIIGGGCGSVCAARFVPGYALGPLGVSMAFGASVALAVYMTRDVSGAHLNPAITAALAVHRPDAVSPYEAACYMGAQLTGATLAAGVNYFLYAKGIAAFEAENGIVRGARNSWESFTGAFGMVPNKALVGVPGCVLAEAAMTGALAFTALAVTDETNNVPKGAAPGLIGITVALLAAQYGPVTGCGMNPARDLGPRLVTLAAGWGSAALSRGWWTYTIGPLAGAIAGAWAYDQTLGAATSAARSQERSAVPDAEV